MTAPTKDKLITISASVIGSVLLTFLGLYATGRVESQKELKLEIKSKVDRIDFDSHCTENKELFKAIQEDQNKQLENIGRTLEKMVDQNSQRNSQQDKMSTDIEWIKRELKK